jgi:hypothetical protein
VSNKKRKKLSKNRFFNDISIRAILPICFPLWALKTPETPPA